MIAHGTASKYTNDRCRCDECRAAWSIYIRALRQRRAAEGLPPSVEHGATTYTNWGCRCRTCVEGMRAEAKERYYLLHPSARRTPRWTQVEISELASSDLPIAELARKFGRSESAVINKQWQLRNAHNNARAAELAHARTNPKEQS